MRDRQRPVRPEQNVVNASESGGRRGRSVGEAGGHQNVGSAVAGSCVYSHSHAERLGEGLVVEVTLLKGASRCCVEHWR